jgi:hypothetical protein
MRAVACSSERVLRTLERQPSNHPSACASAVDESRRGQSAGRSTGSPTNSPATPAHPLAAVAHRLATTSTRSSTTKNEVTTANERSR